MRGLRPCLALLLVGYLAVTHAIKPDLRRASDVSLEVEDFSGKTLNVSVSHDGMWRLRSRAQDVSPAYLAMLLHIEDSRFYLHPGIDPLAMLRALGQFALYGHVVSGGSTLTMQVARLLHPHRHTLAGKLRDICTALLLEAQLTKPQILDLYLTLAPFGGNIEGVRAASLIYFGHAPNTLTPQEAALLVALPQSPARRRPDRHPRAAQAALNRVLTRLGTASPDQLVTIRHALPSLAPHLTEKLLAAHANGRIRTTLDATLQTAMQALARRETGWFGAGTEMAALIVRNSDRAVLGYLGGSDFFARAGMIDMVRAIRSPGSALKPFIYGMAIDDGLIRPDTRIEDARLRIADYAPQDFDRAFHGTVTAREALQQSYNLPAVTLLDWLGAGRVAATLRGAGAHILIPGGGPATLPLALGGVGMSLWDITTLYTGLANGGLVRPLRLATTDPDGDQAALITRQAATDIITILADAPLPAGLSALSPRRIAYKTGTSFGFRDAWAFGTTPSITIGVWLGRADGTPRPGAFARGTAAPLLFRLFDMLPDDPGWPAPARPETGAPRAPALRQLPPRDGRLFGTNAPRILFPPPDSVMELRPGQTIALEAAGGVPPYQWAVNGIPLAPPPLGSLPEWHPDGAGFAHLTLTDAADHSTQETLRLQ